MRSVSIVFAVLMSTCALVAGPMHEWAKLGKLDKIKQFESVQNKQNKAINWNEQDTEGKTPLMLAASGGHDKTVQYLLAHNANPVLKDAKGKTAFDYATNDYIKAQLAPKNGQTLAPKPINNGNVPQPVVVSPTKASVVVPPAEQVQQPIDHKKEFEKMTQLQAELTSAACQGKLDQVIKTVEKGASASSPDINGNTPLIAAIKCYQMPIDGHNHLAVIDYLLSKGASILIHDRDGKNALHYAVEYENKHIVNRLINSLDNNPNKAEIINAQDRNGDTPLHYAAATSSFDLVETLLRNDANKNAHNNAGKNPLDVLGTKRSISEINRQNIKKHADEIRKLLSPDVPAKRASNDNNILQKAKEGKINALKYLIAIEKPDINAPFQGKTLLMEAVINYKQPHTKETQDATKLDFVDYDQVITFLLSQGASMTLGDDKERTVFHYAVLSRDPRVLELLLNNIKRASDYPFNISDINDITPLHLAAAYANEKMVRLLGDAGAKIDLKTRTEAKMPIDMIGEYNKQASSETKAKIRDYLYQLTKLRGMTQSTNNASAARAPVTTREPGKSADEFSVQGRKRGSTIIQPRMISPSEKPTAARQAEKAEEPWGKPGIVTFDQETGDTHIEIPASDDESEDNGAAHGT